MIELISALKSATRLLEMTSAAVVFSDHSVLLDDQNTKMAHLVQSFRRAPLSSNVSVSSLTHAADSKDSFWQGILVSGNLIVRRLDADTSQPAYLILFGEHEFTHFSEQQRQTLCFAEAALKHLVSQKIDAEAISPLIPHDDMFEFVNKNTSMIAIVDNDLRFAFANDKCLEGFKLSQEEVIGKRVPEVIGEAVYETSKESLVSALNGQKTTFLLTLRHRDGEVAKILEVVCTPKHHQGRQVGLYVVAQNVTPQQKTLQTLRNLHQITANSTTALEDKLQSILAVGVSQYGLPLGIISKIHGNTYTVKYCVSPDNELSPGMAFDLGQTYCVHTLNNGEPTYFHHTSKSTIKDHPCYQNFGLEAYIGALIKIDGESWGTLNFSSPHPKEERFSEDDIELMKLLAQWVGNEITRHNTLEKLQASEQQQHLLLNSAHDGFLGINSDGQIIFANQAACHITGYQLEELLGQHHHPLLHHSQADGTPYPLSECPVSRTVLTGESSQSLAEPLWGKNGLFIAEYNCVAMRDINGLVQGAVITFQDRTQQLAVEQEMLEQKRLFESLFVDAPSAIALVNKHREVVMVNPAFCVLFGYSADEIVGQNTAMLYACEEEYSRIGDAYYSDTDVKVNPLERVAYVNKCGRVFYCETAGSMIKGKQGEIEGYIGHMTDITSRLQDEKERQRANQRFSMASDAASIGVWEWDLSTNELVWDDWMYRLFGVEKEEVSDPYQVWKKCIHPDDVAALNDKIETFIQGGERFDTDFRIVRLDGQVRHLKANGVLECGREGHSPKLIGVNLDITSQIETEAILRKASNEAELANKAKSDFLATMSHEIRTPLNGVLGMAELLSHSPLSAEQASQLGILQESGESLLELINEILDFSKIEAGQLAIESVDFDLEKTLYDVVRLLMVSAEKKGLDLLVEYPSYTPTNFIGDAFRIKQVLINLVSNAIKFTHTGQVVVAVVSALGELGRANLSIKVTDSGVGIAKGVQASLFKAFTQEDSSTTRKFGGTGLGLAITKQLVELMGGSIMLQSEEGVGSSFTVSLTLVESYLKQPSESVDLSQWQHAKALIVDDNEINLMILSNQLSELGIQCDQELSSVEGYKRIMSAAKKQPYDLIILDYQMPELDGLALSALVREQSGNDYAPAIIMASSSGRLKQDSLQKAGVNVCLTKPVDSHSLSLGVDAALNSQVLAKPVSYFSSSEKASLYTEKDFPQFSGCVLIVEDMQANIAVARGLIEKMGFEILEAVNGEIAVQQWQKHRPDLILMDLHMPVMDGLTAMRAIRHIEKNDPLNRSTPIFALTADAHAERLADVERAGGDGLIAKPFKKGDLVRLFKQYFHQQESSRDVKLSHESDKNEEGIGTDKVVLDQAVLDELKLVLGADLEILFQAFFSDAEGIIETLKNVSEESVDLTAIARAAHSMKSISQNLGGRDLSALAERIEKAAKQEEVQEVCALITLLIKEYTLFSEALNKER